MNAREALRQRYSYLHPLLFHRSAAKARTDGDLFDMLDTCPDAYPLIWDEASRSWQYTDNLLQAILTKKST